MSSKKTVGSVTLFLASLFAAIPADAQMPRCQVPPFAGASSPNGAESWLLKTGQADK